MEFYEYSDMVQQWVGHVLEYRQRNARLTIKYCEDIIAFGTKNEDHKLLGFAYFYLGETYYGLNDGSKFFEIIGKALSHLTQVEEWELVAHCYNYLGIAALNRGNAPIAMDYYISGLNYCRAYQMKKLSIIFLINLGVLNNSCGRYEEAQEYLERASCVVHEVADMETFYGYMFGIDTNLIRCLMCQGKMAEAQELFDQIHTEFWKFGECMDYIVVNCMEAMYFHRLGQEEKRNVCISWVNENLPENMSVLDFFEDLYEYSLVLLETDKEEAFWHVIDVLEALIKNFNIINLHLKIISLKMKFYRKREKNAEYLQAAGLYYELSEIMETETKDMLKNVLTLRKNLEWVNRAKEKVEQQNKILQEKSEMDQLTKIANRFRINDYSDEIFTHAGANELSLAVEILDVDYFKEFNDNYGHQSGDFCLTEVARVLRELAEENHGFCGRYGGDEFVVIYEGVTYEQAVSLAAELRKRIMDLEMEHKFSKALPIVTVSQGVCWGKPDKSSRMWDFLHTADEMLYQVKRFSRNNYCVGKVGKDDDVTMGVV